MRRNKIQQYIYVALAFLGLGLTSCDNAFLDNAQPKGQMAPSNVFANAGVIGMAVNGLYYDYSTGLGSRLTIRTLQWLSDEGDYKLNPAYSFIYYTKANYEPIDPLGYCNTTWNAGYLTIYQANLLLEGLPSSTVITDAQRDAYLAAAYFMRGLNHFYLALLFGDVPLVLTSDATTNVALARTEKAKVMAQVVSDMETALAKLPATAPADTRYYTSKYQVEAYLSYVYLALGQWAKAEAAATDVITNGGFSLVTDLTKILNKGSKEAILSVGSTVETTYPGTDDYGVLINVGQAAANMSPSDSLVRAYGSSDPRLDAWLPNGTVSGSTVVSRIPKKYKYSLSQAQTGASKADPQTNVLLRLAEVYLIRAEARAQQATATSIAAGIDDINVIRNRAGATPIPTDVTYTKEQAMAFVETERVLELSFEGKRWLDLARWGTTDQVYQNLKGNFKTGWASYKALLPVPATQLDANSNLKPQNPGYAQ